MIGIQDCYDMAGAFEYSSISNPACYDDGNGPSLGQLGLTREMPETTVEEGPFITLHLVCVFRFNDVGRLHP